MTRVETAQQRLQKAKEELAAAEKDLAEAQAEVKSSKKRKRSEEKPDVEGLKKAVKKARKAMKADKNKETKAALKAAKAALEEAEKAAEESSSSEEEESEKSEEAEKSEEVADEPMKPSNASGSAPAGVANPNNCDKVFCGNLSFQIDEETIRAFFKDCGDINEVFWLEDKESGKFKGCGFVTFASTDGASKAVALNGQDCMGRDIKIDFSLPRERKKRDNGASKFGSKPLSEKPDNCTTVFAGNLSFTIDDDQMREFAEDCGEIKGIRWLTDRDSGDFKGCGFIEFFETEAVDKFVKKNGTELLGRPIRLDYSSSRPKR